MDQNAWRGAAWTGRSNIPSFDQMMSVFFMTAATVLGLLIGSFLNVVIHRGPAIWKLVDDDRRRGDLVAPRSYCPACGAQIKTLHLIPLLGFALTGGKCTACNAPISWRYPIVELLGAAAALGAYWLFGASLAAAAAAILFWSLIALAVIDFETGFLPDAITLPLALIGLAVNAWAGLFATWQAALIGAVAGYAVFWLIAEIFYRLRGVEGLGLGDAKLLGALGAWMGWQTLPAIVFIGSIIGLVLALTMRASGRKISAQTALPFGPALAISGAAVFTAAALAPF